MSTEEYPDEPVELPPTPLEPEAVAPPSPIEEGLLEFNDIGDVLMVAADATLPDGWELLDGRTRITSEYPEFAEHMGIADATFELLSPTAVRPGTAFAVRLR